MRINILAAAVALLTAATAAEAAQEAAEDFDRFEDNIAMESERQFLTMNFADFASHFPKTPDLADLLNRAGLFSESATFGKRTGSSSSSAAVTADRKEESLPTDENQSRKTNVTLGPEARKSGKTDLGRVVSQLLAGGQGVEDVHQELSGLLFGGQPPDQAGAGGQPRKYRLSKSNFLTSLHFTDIQCRWSYFFLYFVNIIIQRVF